MWVKICANTSAEDALKAVELGADAIGFVFAPSQRQVTPTIVKAITEQLPSNVERVGVFTERDVDAIANAVARANLTTVQLHGGVDLDFAGRLRERLGVAASIIHVAHWDVGMGERALDDVGRQLLALESAGLGERILIDAKIGGVSGGLGISFDWHQAAWLLDDFVHLRLIVAGGLRPDNVAEAVRIVRPFGVDIASGVEASPGKKDFGKLKSFIENARRA